jgi:23S rRNA pseudouridine1911/1915/1917 synthase
MSTCDIPHTCNVRYLTQTILPAWDGVEVGALLRRELQLSSTLIKRVKWLPDGLALDGERCTTRTRCRAGQVLRVRLSDAERRSGLEPLPGALDILYEDEDILVLNKAPGVPVHPNFGSDLITIGNILLNYYDSKGILADFHPVHRLDKGTSGALVVAKHGYAQDVLRRALHTEQFVREYLAVCDGAPERDHDIIDLPIAHAPHSPIRHEVRADGLPARTEYWVLRRTEQRALLRMRLQTGRTHQIRVHMAAIGCPLTGDFLYGREDRDLISRPALHSHSLAFSHPLTGEGLSFTVPLPEDMAALL